MAERGRPRHPDILTPRQFEVLELLRERLTNPEIAERLGISPDGAKWHVKEILWKLDVPSREEAVRWQRERQQPAPTAILGTWRVAQPVAPAAGPPAVSPPRVPRRRISRSHPRPNTYLIHLFNLLIERPAT